MNTLIIILILLALVLFALEIFVFPGFGISGIGGIASLGSAIYLIYNEYGGNAALGTLVASGLLLALCIWWVMRSKAIERVSLKSTIDSTAATQAQLSVKVGDKGKALTRLALIGNARINGQVVEVKSSGEFLSEGTPIQVIAVNEALIIVEELHEA